MNNDDAKTILAILGMLVSYLYWKTDLSFQLIEDRVAISTVLTGSAFVLWFFSRRFEKE
ncbi:MAG: hypothetical protein ACRD38_01305 [Nitrososphaerales archaeon]